MANVLNPSRAVEFSWEAFKRRGKASPRERALIEAYARYLGTEKEPETVLVDAESGRRRAIVPKRTAAQRRRLLRELAVLAAASPRDVEVRALRLREWSMGSPASRPRDPRVVDIPFAELFAVAPSHPAWRYRIDTALSGPRVALGLDCALKSGLAAPSIGRMWNAGGRLYASRGRWDDAAWMHEAAARVDNGFMSRSWAVPYEIPEYALNGDALCRSLVRAGRFREAIETAKLMIRHPRHPRLRDGVVDLGRRRLLEALAKAELWNETITLARSAWLAGGS